MANQSSRLSLAGAANNYNRTESSLRDKDVSRAGGGFSLPPSRGRIVIPSITARRRSDPCAFVGAPWPLKRNSTIARASTDVFARYVGVDGVGIEVRVGRRYLRRDRALFDVLSDLTHPFLDGDLPAFPHELAHRDHASDAHAAHQHHEHAADVRQAQLVRRRAALRRFVLFTENGNTQVSTIRFEDTIRSRTIRGMVAINLETLSLFVNRESREISKFENLVGFVRNSSKSKSIRVSYEIIETRVIWILDILFHLIFVISVFVTNNETNYNLCPLEWRGSWEKNIQNWQNLVKSIYVSTSNVWRSIFHNSGCVLLVQGGWACYWKIWI